MKVFTFNHNGFLVSSIGQSLIEANHNLYDDCGVDVSLTDLVCTDRPKQSSVSAEYLLINNIKNDVVLRNLQAI